MSLFFVRRLLFLLLVLVPRSSSGFLIHVPRQAVVVPPQQSWSRQQRQERPRMTPPLPSGVRAMSPSYNNDSSNRRRKLPTQTRIDYTDAGTLSLKLPPRGVTSESVFAGAFSAAWFAAIAPAALTGGVGAVLFTLPFWLAGGMVAKNAVYDPFLATHLTIGKYAWSLENYYLGKTVDRVEGATDELSLAEVRSPMVVNEKPQYVLQFGAGSNGIVEFGLGLPVEELEQLADAINEHLESILEEEPMPMIQEEKQTTPPILESTEPWQ